MNASTFDFNIKLSSREEVRLYTADYCNSCNRTAAFDDAHSSGHTVVYICKEAKTSDRPCPFKLVWKKSRRVCKNASMEWQPSEALSCLQHPIGVCSGSAELTRLQVLSNPELRSIVTTHQSCKRMDLLRSLPLPLQSKDDNALRMACRIIKDIRSNDSKYIHAYSGVASWVAEFKERNPGSLAACESTTEGEFLRVMVAPKCLIDAVVLTNIRIHALDAGTVTANDGYKGVVLVLEAMDYVLNKEGMRYVVNYDEKNCSCGQWQQHRLICSHGIAAAFHIKRNKTSPSYYDEIIGECYRSSTYCNAFHSECAISLPDLDNVIPDATIKPRGMTRGSGLLTKRRTKSASEPGAISSRTAKQRRLASEHMSLLQYDDEGNELPVEKPVHVVPKRTVVCKLCGAKGHMKKTCEKKEVKMSIDDFDTHLCTDSIPQEEETFLIPGTFASV